jgi:hypothetical protein
MNEPHAANLTLDYRTPHPDDRRAPSWLLKLLATVAAIAFPFFYALFAVALIITPFLILAGLATALLGLTACALTAVATFGALWTIDYCLTRHGDHTIP